MIDNTERILIRGQQDVNYRCSQAVEDEHHDGQRKFVRDQATFDTRPVLAQHALILEFTKFDDGVTVRFDQELA